MSLTVKVQNHTLLDVGAFVSRWAQPMRDVPRLDPLLALAAPGAVAPLCSSESVRTEVRKYRELMELCGATTEDVVLAK